jgi:hypothetical protein
MRPEDDISSLGRILVAISACTYGQALRACETLPHMLLGEALVALGYCTQEEVDRAVQYQRELRSTAPDMRPARAAMAIVRESCKRFSLPIDVARLNGSKPE